ncbi:hypothetical protein M9Y10_042018 [Tritrichomonas musculus]|uniref:Uncharacterized protein n=1 Tax=Tritrichomonas musculus TaxID=1915356 RepID=A0ABR2K659_9EUKA
MTTEIKDGTFLWVTCIFVLLANIAILIVLYIFQPPILKKLYHPLIVSMFIAEALILFSGSSFDKSKLVYTERVICALVVFCWAVLDIFLGNPNESNDSTNNNADANQDNETNQDNEADEPRKVVEEENEAPAVNENNEKPSNDKKIDTSNFDFRTAIFAVLMWVTYMMNGMVIFNKMRYLNEGTLQYFFYFFFRQATLQFMYGEYIINQGVSKLFYLIYMAPQAVLWPLAAIISYYVHQRDISRMEECASCFYAFMTATLYYSVFKIYFQYPEYVKDDLKNKGIHLLFLIIGFTWIYLISSIGYISNYHY